MESGNESRKEANVAIRPINRIDLRHRSQPIDFADDLKARVAEHWQAALEGNPRLWNGRVLMTLAPDQPGGIKVTDGVFSAEAVDIDFAAFLAWRDWGFPEMGFRNVFGSPLVLAADGCLLYGLMAAWTVNAGMTYPPGGSLEPRDIRSNGAIDVLGSIETELLEETGLNANEASRKQLLAVFDGPRVSLAEVLRFDLGAEELQARARDHIAAEAHPELDDLVILRSPSDLDAGRTPAYALALARHLLA